MNDSIQVPTQQSFHGRLRTHKLGDTRHTLNRRRATQMITTPMIMTIKNDYYALVARMITTTTLNGQDD